MAVGVVGFSVISVSNVYAQDNVQSGGSAEGSEDGGVYYDPSDYQQWKENFKETPVEDMGFRKNKKGCAQKMAFTTVMIKKYKSGEGLEELADSPILGPYMKKQYDLVRQKGVLQAQKDMMHDYQECIKKAQAEEDPGDEYDLDMRYGACDSLNTILMGTIDGIKKRQSMDTVIQRYKKRFPDLSETSYGDIKDPVPLFIGRLYQIAKGADVRGEKEMYESLYDHASQLVVACAM